MHLKNKNGSKRGLTLILFGVPQIKAQTNSLVYVDIRAIYNDDNGSGDKAVFLKELLTSQKDRIFTYAKKLANEKIKGKYKIVPQLRGRVNDATHPVSKRDGCIVQTALYRTHAIFCIEKIL